MKSVEAAAASLALPVAVARVKSRDDIETAITDLARVPNSGLIISPDLFTATKAQRDTIIELTARNHIPAVYFLSLFARTGGLVAYGVDHPDLLRAGFGGRLLPGYDFVGEDYNPSSPYNALGTFLIANDGDGWDPDPSDPGDWISSTDTRSVSRPLGTWSDTQVL